jgi:signal transduction histidine kinase
VSPALAANERIQRTERVISYIRASVVVFNSVTYLAFAPDSDRRPFAIAIIVLALAYSAGTLFFEPRNAHLSYVTAFVNMLLDNVLIVFWIWATGSAASPYYPLLYAEAAASVGRFGPRVGSLAAVGSAALYLGVVLTDGGAPAYELTARIGYIFVIVAFVSYVADVAARSERDAVESDARADSYREMEALRATFVTNISHELRTPLTAIRGASSTLVRRRGSLGEPETQALIEMLDRQSQHLAYLVQDIIDVGLAEQGAFVAQMAPVDIVALVKSEIERAAERSGRSIVLEPPPDRQIAECDGPKIANALRKLLDNAVKFSEGDTEVTVSVSVTDADLAISVVDRGLGILAGDEHRIFERFYQIAGSHTRSAEGTGLGLSVVKAIADLHGGWVDVASTPGRGTRFTLRIPLRSATAADPGSEAAFLPEALIDRAGPGGDEDDAGRTN